MVVRQMYRVAAHGCCNVHFTLSKLPLKYNYAVSSKHSFKYNCATSMVALKSVNSSSVACAKSTSTLHGMKLPQQITHQNNDPIPCAESTSTLKLPRQITIQDDDPKQKTPLVVIFGWGNAKQQHLLKYIDLFKRKQFSVVCVQTTLLNSLFRYKKLQDECSALRRIVDDLRVGNPGRPIILYPLSGGGYGLYCIFVETMYLVSLKQQPENIKGVIFDSCPVIYSAESALRIHKAFTRIHNNGFIEHASWPLIKLAVITYQAGSYILNKELEGVKRFKNSFKNPVVKCPQLFLFSKKDDLAPSKDIQEFLENRQEQGVDVSYKCWDDSLHVGHMQKYPDEYVDIVGTFVYNCLKK